MLKENEVYNLDFRDGLKKLKDNSIDLIFTDPPYLLRDIWVYRELFLLAKRKLKKGKFLFVYTSTLHLDKIMASVNDILNYEWLYCIKHNKTSNLYDNHICNCKYVICFCKGFGNSYKKHETLFLNDYPLKTFHTWGQGTAFAKFIYKNYTKENDLIVDTFMGGGSFIKAAIETNRRYIGFDIKDFLVNAMKERIKNGNV